MKNLKSNKGITLIALIITIIVLLILAVVTISAVNEGNIFAHANNAATKWNAAATEENIIISNYLTEMAKHDGETEKAEDPQGGGSNPDPVVDPELSALVGKYYICNGKGCNLFVELKKGNDCTYFSYNGKYSVNTTTKTIDINIDIGESEPYTMTGTYDIMKNSSDDIENIIFKFEDKVCLKKPGIAPNIEGIYLNAASNTEYKFQINTNSDGVQYIATYYSSIGGTSFEENEDAWYCLYNSTDNCYDLYYGQHYGELTFKCDGNNTITDVIDNNKEYLRQN